MSAGRRSIRVGEQLLRELADLLEHKVRDPRVRRVTLTRVSMSNDLRFARVYYSALEEGRDLTQVQEGLESAKGFMKREIGVRLDLRYIPELAFRHDPSLEHGEYMERLLRDLRPEGSLEEDGSGEK
ncbi:MAG: 30S ribosome-binding factor RbfA [Desulfobacteraceae bacterium]